MALNAHSWFYNCAFLCYKYSLAVSHAYISYRGRLWICPCECVCVCVSRARSQKMFFMNFIISEINMKQTLGMISKFQKYLKWPIFGQFLLALLNHFVIHRDYAITNCCIICLHCSCCSSCGSCLQSSSNRKLFVQMLSPLKFTI